MFRSDVHLLLKAAGSHLSFTLMHQLHVKNIHHISRSFYSGAGTKTWWKIPEQLTGTFAFSHTEPLENFREMCCISAVAKRGGGRPPTRRSAVRSQFSSSACRGILGQDTKPQLQLIEKKVLLIDALYECGYEWVIGKLYCKAPWVIIKTRKVHYKYRLFTIYLWMQL